MSLLRRLGRKVGVETARAAVDRAIEHACAELRRDVPWYFASADRLTRWLTIVAFRAEALQRPPRNAKVPIPMLGELEEPHRSMLLFFRCDDFRLNFDLPYVFRVQRREAERLLREADRLWQELFEQ